MPDLHLAVDLSDTGARAAVWRDLGARSARPFDPVELASLLWTAERGLLDFALLDRRFTVRVSSARPDGSGPTAALTRLARTTEHLGLVAATGAEPAAVTQALVRLDHASAGRAGWHVTPPGTHGEPSVVQEVRDTWARWDDQVGTVEVPAPSPRYVARDGVHFAASPASPAEVPHPVQDQVPVVVRAVTTADLTRAGATADVVRVEASDAATAAARRDTVRAGALAAGRRPDDVRVLVDVSAVIGPDETSAAARFALLTDVEDVSVHERSLLHVGTADALAVLVEDWFTGGAADGFVVRPCSLRTDLHGLVDGVVPLLQARGVHRRTYPGRTLRETLALTAPVVSPV